MIAPSSTNQLPLVPRIGKWLRRFWAPVLLITVSMGYSVGITLQHSQALSPIDEWVYMDYLQKVPSQGIVRQGEPIGEAALEYMACVGSFPFGLQGPPCGTDYVNELQRFPLQGTTSADGYPPFFFWTVYGAGATIHAVIGGTQLDAWRLVGSLWLGATLLLFYFITRRLKIPDTAYFGLGLVFTASPFAWWTYTYISTDASSSFFGAALLLAALRFGRSRVGLWLLPLLSAAAVVYKVTNIFGVLLVALYLAGLWVLDLVRARRAERIRNDSSFIDPNVSLLTAVLATLFALIVQVAWLRIHSMLAISTADNQGISQQLDLKTILNQLINFLPGTLSANVPLGSGYALNIPAFLTAPLSWLIIAGVIGAFWRYRVTSDEGMLFSSTAVASVAFAPLLALALTVATGAYFALPSRYGAALLPAFLASTGVVLTTKKSRVLLIIYGTLLMIVMLVISLRLPE